MKKVLVTLFILSIPCLLFAKDTVKYDKELTEKIAEIIKETAEIKVGSARKELLKYYTTEGGISHPKQRTYASRRCPYIKVDVEFELEKVERKGLEEKNSDRIIKISKPYLQWAILD